MSDVHANGGHYENALSAPRPGVPSIPPYPRGTQIETDVFRALKLRNASSPRPLNAAQAIHKRRNKPTLNCANCVERKIKCDRRRPACLACIRRQTACRYTTAAKGVATSKSTGIRALRSAPISASYVGIVPAPDSPLATNGAAAQTPEAPPLKAAFDPFENYWTREGGVAEIISVLPGKEAADGFVASFFLHADPGYPIVPHQTFLADYESYWQLSLEEKFSVDPSQLALQIAVLACGSLYSDANADGDWVVALDFLLSACHQALFLSSHLSVCKLRTVQTIILVCHCLIATDRTSHAWTFSGIAQRQAYALQLHRPPEIAAPDAPFAERQLRCRLWLALVVQETTLSHELNLPPPTLYHDIEPSCLTATDSEQYGLESELNRAEDPSARPISDLISERDVLWLQLLWRYAVLVQTYISVPAAFHRPLFTSKAAKFRTVSALQELYITAHPPFNSTDAARFEGLDKRLTRQLLLFNIHFFCTMATLLMEENESAGIEMDQSGALIAAYEGLSTYFAYARLLPERVALWGTMQRQAFAQAHIIGTILARISNKGKNAVNDSRLLLAKEAFDRFVDLLPRSSSSALQSPMQARISEMHELRAHIQIG